MTHYSILVVDDEKIQRESLAGFLRKKGYRIYAATHVEQAIGLVRDHLIDIVLTDYKMPGQSGIDLLKKVKEINPEIEVILMTAYGNIGNAVVAMKAGAFD
jgi:two-component system NtrC family response regulator